MSKRVCIILSLIITMTTIFSAPAMAADDSNVDGLDVQKVNAKLYSSEKVTITWKEADEAEGYTIYELNDDDKYKAVKTIKDDEKTTCRLGKVDKGETHEYAVKAYDLKDGSRVYADDYVSDEVYVPKKITPSSKGYSTTTAAKLMKVAKSKIGCQYVSGAAGPNQFDCSGFVYYCLKKSGVSSKSVSRTSSSSMYSKLKKYSIGNDLSKAQTGDLVFTSYGSRISHVAFYYGGGKLIHATNTRTDVMISPAKWYGNVVGIVRLPNL